MGQVQDAIDELKEHQQKPPRRYEIINAETGEPVTGVSFLLTPTGEEMHLLSDEHRVGPLKLGIYYTGNVEDAPGPGGPRGEYIIKDLTLGWILNRSLDKLARKDDSVSRNAENRIGDLRRIAQRATKLADEIEDVG